MTHFCAQTGLENEEKVGSRGEEKRRCQEVFKGADLREKEEWSECINVGDEEDKRETQVGSLGIKRIEMK